MILLFKLLLRLLLLLLFLLLNIVDDILSVSVPAMASTLKRTFPLILAVNNDEDDEVVAVLITAGSGELLMGIWLLQAVNDRCGS